MGKRILYRANASKHIGMGHISRGMLLSHYLRSLEDIHPTFLIDEDSSISLYLKNFEFEFVKIRPSSNWQAEVKEIQLAKNEGKLNLTFDIAFIDILDFDQHPGYIDYYKSFCKSVIAITDDSFPRPMNADLIINGNPMQTLDFYRDHTKYLLGPRYFIMDKKYSLVQAKNLIPSDLDDQTWLLTLGGSDHNDLIFRTLRAFERLSKCPRLLIAITSVSGYVERLKECLANSKLNSEVILDRVGLRSLWDQVDFAITAGGNTLFERIASGTPGATICQLKRQNEIANAFQKAGVNLNLGLALDLNDEELFKGICELTTQGNYPIPQFTQLRNAVDGKGLIRICSELKTRGILNEL